MADDTNAEATDNTNAEASTETTTEAVVPEVTEATTETEAKPPEGDTDAKEGDSKNKEADAENQQETVYDFVLPEGFTVNEELSGDLKAFATENKLSAEQAQGVVDMGVKMQQMQMEEFTTQIQGWESELKADKTFGGDKFDQTVSQVKSAMQEFGGDELVDVLRESGLGSNPAVFKAFLKIQQSVSNDQLVVTNGNNKSAAKSAANVLFPNQN